MVYLVSMMLMAIRYCGYFFFTSSTRARVSKIYNLVAYCCIIYGREKILRIGSKRDSVKSEGTPSLRGNVFVWILRKSQPTRRIQGCTAICDCTRVHPWIMNSSYLRFLFWKSWLMIYIYNRKNDVIFTNASRRSEVLFTVKNLQLLLAKFFPEGKA